MFSATKGMEWKFLPADPPWQNGTSEALVKSVKKVIMVAVGESVMTFSELQTVCYERQQTWLTKGQLVGV